jgi:hypothetical protein
MIIHRFVARFMSNSKNIRKFERLLFNGIPEQPEPAYERNDYANVSMRHTGKAQASVTPDSPKNAVVLGHFVYDREKETTVYIEEKSLK